MPENNKTNRNRKVRETICQLERNLLGQLELHQSLRTCIERKREAIRTAQVQHIEGICQQEKDIVLQLGELEKKRLGLTGDLTETLHPDADQPMTIEQIVTFTTPEQGRKLQELRDRLKAIIVELRRSSTIVRVAMEKLNKHMIGIRQIVHSALSRAGVYSSQGKVAIGAQLDFSVDIKS